MLNKITQNIIEGDKNLNNPEIFYNELFAKIINNKNAEISSSKIIKNIRLRKTLKNKGTESKKVIKKKKSLFQKSYVFSDLSKK